MARNISKYEDETPTSTYLGTRSKCNAFDRECQGSRGYQDIIYDDTYRPIRFLLLLHLEIRDGYLLTRCGYVFIPMQWMVRISYLMYHIKTQLLQR